MFEAIFICEGVLFLGVKRLSVVSEDFQGHSFRDNQFNQATYNSTHGGKEHLKYKEVLGEIIYNK